MVFESVAEFAGKSAVAALLTGMGADGAQGMLKIQQAGGKTIAQDEATSAICGMPKAATDLGAADQILPDYKNANAISVLCRET